MAPIAVGKKAMSDFQIRRFDYPIYYAYIGIRVRGILRPIAIFKEYWYGRRVDRIVVENNPRKAHQQEWRATIGYAAKIWLTYTPAMKDEFREVAKRKRLLGWNIHMARYLNAIMFWADSRATWGDIGHNWSAFSGVNWSDFRASWGDGNIGWASIAS